MTAECIGPRCHAKAVHNHHLVFAQHVRWYGGDLKDERNFAPVCLRCHERMHARIAPFPAWSLPDAVFVFAAELMGGPAAYEYIHKKYPGGDRRLDALLEQAA